MKPNLLPFRRTIFSSCLVLAACLSLPAVAATFRSFTEAVSGSYFFQQPVYWVGEEPPSEAESQLLFKILDDWRVSQQIGLAELEAFLETYTNSVWAPSLHANLGKFYRDSGRYTPALEHWEQAWVGIKPTVSGRRGQDRGRLHPGALDPVARQFGPLRNAH